MSEEILTENQFKYHLEEYKSLKVEISDHIRESFRIVILSIGANSAFLSFLISNQSTTKNAILFAAYKITPMIVTLFAFALHLLKRRSVEKYAEYLCKIEGKLAHPELGWDRFYSKDIKDRSRMLRTPFVLNTIMTLQLAVATVIAVYL